MAEEKEIIRLEIDDSQASRKVAELTAEIQQMTQARKDARKEGTATAEQEAYWQRTLKESRQELNAYQKVLNEQVGSIKRLKAETNVMVRERDKLNRTTKEGRKRFNELTKAINKNDAVIRKSDQKIGNFRANVGNYAGGIKEAFNGIGSNIAASFGPQGIIAAAVAVTTALMRKALQTAKEIVSESVKLADIQLKAEAKVMNAVKGNTEEFERFLKLASDRQKVTLFGDEETLNAIALTRAITQNGDATERLIPLIQDLSAAKNIDLSRAAEMVSKSFAAGTSNLKQYGVEAVGAAGSSQRLDSIVNGLSENFGDFAETVAESGTGSVKQLQNAFGDAEEELGRGLVPVMNKLAAFMANEFVPIFAAGMGGVGEAIIEAANAFIDLYNESRLFRAAIHAITPTVVAFGSTLVLALKEAVNLTGGLSKSITRFFKRDFAGASEAINDTIRKSKDNIGDFIAANKKALEDLAENVNLDEPLEKLTYDTKAAKKFFEPFVNESEKAAKKAKSHILEQVGLGTVLEDISLTLDQAGNKYEQTQQSLLDNQSSLIIQNQQFVNGVLANTQKGFDEFERQMDDNDKKALERIEKRKKAFRTLEFVTTNVFSNMANVLGAFAQASEGNEKRQRKLQKAAGVFDIKSNLIREISGIWKNSTSLGIFGTIWAGIQTAFATARAAAGISQLKSLHTGGWTGSGFMPDPNVSGHNIAGVVHQNEYVIPERMTMNPAFHGMINTLERYRTGKISGFAGGGATSGIPAMTTINQSGGISPGELRRALEGMNVYVKVTDINEAQGTRARVMNGATI